MGDRGVDLLLISYDPDQVYPALKALLARADDLDLAACKIKCIATRDGFINSRDFFGFQFGPGDLAAKFFLEFKVPVHMVMMPMRGEYIGEAPAFICQNFQDRRSFRGVDCSGLAGYRIVDENAEIV